MFKVISLAGHAALLSFFIYLQTSGESIFGSDEDKPQPGGQHSTYHK